MALASVYHLGAGNCSTTRGPVSSTHYSPSLCWLRCGHWPAQCCYIAIPWDAKEEQFPEICLALLRIGFRCGSLDGRLRYASWCETSILWSYSRCPARLRPGRFWRTAL